MGGETLKGLKESLKSISSCLLILNSASILLVASRLSPHLTSPIIDHPGSHEKKEKDILALNPLCSHIQIQKKMKRLYQVDQTCVTPSSLTMGNLGNQHFEESTWVSLP